MTEQEFFPYHNKHASLNLKNETKLSGVVFDSQIKEKPTLYNFVSSLNMIEWRKAQESGNQVAQKALCGQIDLLDIESAELLNH